MFENRILYGLNSCIIGVRDTFTAYRLGFIVWY